MICQSFAEVGCKPNMSMKTVKIALRIYLSFVIRTCSNVSLSALGSYLLIDYADIAVSGI